MIIMLGGTTEKMCPAAKRLYIVSLILAIWGSICLVVGIGLPYWHVRDDVHDGVFQFCRKNLKDCETYGETERSNVEYRDALFFPLLWALIILGFIFLVVGLVFLFTYPIRKQVDHCKAGLALTAGVLLSLAVISILAALIIYQDWYVRYDSRYSEDWSIWEDIGFSWYITLLGVISITVCIICFGLHMFFLLYYSDRTNKVHAYDIQDPYRYSRYK